MHHAVASAGAEDSLDFGVFEGCLEVVESLVGRTAVVACSPAVGRLVDNRFLADFAQHFKRLVHITFVYRAGRGQHGNLVSRLEGLGIHHVLTFNHSSGNTKHYKQENSP